MAKKIDNGPRYSVVVKSFADAKYQEVIGDDMTFKEAEKCRNGVRINMNTDAYYVQIRKDIKKQVNP